MHILSSFFQKASLDLFLNAAGLCFGYTASVPLLVLSTPGGEIQPSRPPSSLPWISERQVSEGMEKASHRLTWGFLVSDVPATEELRYHGAQLHNASGLVGLGTSRIRALFLCGMCTPVQTGQLKNSYFYSIYTFEN